MAKRAGARRTAKKTRKTTKSRGSRQTAARKTTKRKSAKRKSAKRARPAAPRIALDVARPADEEALKQELDAAIRAFNVQRAPLLQKAFAEGGDAAVAELEQRHEALRTAFFDLLQRQLDRNNAQFEELTRAATQESAALKDAIERLEKIASIIKRAASVVGMIGKVITVLGV